jgi:hypothetical protein
MDTGWEEVLWWGFGVGVRNGTYSNAAGVTPSIKEQAPASLLEILEYAKSKNVKLMVGRFASNSRDDCVHIEAVYSGG